PAAAVPGGSRAVRDLAPADAGERHAVPRRAGQAAEPAAGRGLGAARLDRRPGAVRLSHRTTGRASHRAGLPNPGRASGRGPRTLWGPRVRVDTRATPPSSPQ